MNPILTKGEDPDTVEIRYQQVPPEDLREELLSYTTEVEQETEDQSTDEGKDKDKEKPTFGPRPDTKSPNFDFKKELERLPFELDIREAPLTKEQQARMIDIIYDHQEVFSLYNGDLGYCDALKHSIPTTTNKPVYLPHRQIPVQLQSEVHKCLDN